MALGLGRTISNPAFLFFQILHAVSLFFVMLGLTRVLLGVAELSMGTAAVAERTTPQMGPPALSLVMPDRPYATPARSGWQGLHRARGLGEIVYQRANVLDLSLAVTPSSTTTTTVSPPAPPAASLSFLEQLSYCFHVPLASLFLSPVDVSAGTEAQALDEKLRRDAATPGVVEKNPALADVDASIAGRLRDGSERRFYLQHMLAAFLCSYPLATLLQRRKLVLDFVVTIYLTYWLLADIVLRRFFGGGLHWWAACALGMAVMYGATYALCRRKELQEVRLSGGGTTGPAPGVPPTTTMWLKDHRGIDDMIGEEMRVIVRETQRQNGSSGADAHVRSNSYDFLNRLRAPGVAQCSNGAKAVALDVNHGSEEALHKPKTV
ncbi:Integral membrane protein S linking to the trans Golgi network, putative [Leishmania lindenbergi]|uniref:Integral membrane protein S linking to the trans Golgi network n=1 Tax=Leishmania lindenbergi TaxID=651832 RepID=A0AAW3A466_9TRYP